MSDIPNAALTAEQRLHANATTNSIVLGLMVALIEENIPGSAARMQSHVDAMVQRFIADASLNPDVVAEVTRRAKVLLDVRNT